MGVKSLINYDEDEPKEQTAIIKGGGKKGVSSAKPFFVQIKQVYRSLSL